MSLHKSKNFFHYFYIPPSLIKNYAEKTFFSVFRIYFEEEIEI